MFLQENFYKKVIFSTFKKNPSHDSVIVETLKPEILWNLLINYDCLTPQKISVEPSMSRESTYYVMRNCVTYLASNSILEREQRIIAKYLLLW